MAPSVFDRDITRDENSSPLEITLCVNCSSAYLEINSCVMPLITFNISDRKNVETITKTE